MSRPWKQTPESFWAKVKIGKRNECWPWKAGKCGAYGHVKWANRMYYAHRVAAYLSGMVPTMLSPKNRHGEGFVLHKCDNGACCNPRHLYVGSYSRNNRDCRLRGHFKPMLGTANGGGGKLINRQIRAIRKRYAAGDTSQSQLGVVYGVSQRMISLIVRNEAWTHVEE